MAQDRRYRTITVTLDEAVSFAEAQSMIYAIRMLRGVAEVNLAPTGLVELRQYAGGARLDPQVFEP